MRSFHVKKEPPHAQPHFAEQLRPMRALNSKSIFPLCVWIHVNLIICMDEECFIAV